MGTNHSALAAVAVQIPTAGATLEGDLNPPPAAGGIVLFAHGSGSSRHSPRNRFVAQVLQRRGFGTLLTDLLTADEEQADRLTGHLRFDIDLLTGRLASVVDWLLRREGQKAQIGLFGASTGAAAALLAAAQKPQIIGAVVSRGGRPDLAAPHLAEVRAPTLLIVGSLDPQVLQLNRDALELLRGTAELEIVPGASHLFEEPGTLDRAAELAANWFHTHLMQNNRES